MRGKSDDAPRASITLRVKNKTDSPAESKGLVGQHLSVMADRKVDPMDYRIYELRVGLWLMRRQEIDLVAKLVYSALEYQYGGGHPYADPPEALLAHMLGVTEKEVRVALVQLRHLELIKLLRQRSERGRKAYRFTDHIWMYLDPESALLSGRDVVGWEAAGVRLSSARKRGGVMKTQLPLLLRIRIKVIFVQLDQMDRSRGSKAILTENCEAAVGGGYPKAGASPSAPRGVWSSRGRLPVRAWVESRTTNVTRIGWNRVHKARLIPQPVAIWWST